MSQSLSQLPHSISDELYIFRPGRPGNSTVGPGARIEHNLPLLWRQDTIHLATKSQYALTKPSIALGLHHHFTVSLPFMASIPVVMTENNFSVLKQVMPSLHCFSDSFLHAACLEELVAIHHQLQAAEAVSLQPNKQPEWRLIENNCSAFSKITISTGQTG